MSTLDVGLDFSAVGGVRYEETKGLDEAYNMEDDAIP